MNLCLPLAACLLGCSLAPLPLAAAQGVGPAVVIPNPYPSGVVYILQHDADTVSQIIESRAGWKIIEPSTNGLPSGDITPQQVALMQSPGTDPCGSVVLAYLSIGEAEDYNSYWNPAWVDAGGEPTPGVAPSWLGPENPDWQGNYKVRYWHRGWKDLLWGTRAGPGRTPLDRIIDQGFDGVYLDVVDAYEFWSDQEGEITRRLARERMTALIEQIAQYAASERGVPHFRVVIQNGAEIVLDDNDQPDDLRDRLAHVVGGIGLEDVFYDGSTPQPPAHAARVLAAARAMFETLVYPAAPHFLPPPIFAIDYVIRGRNINSAANRARATDFYARCADAGLLPYAARSDRDLDEVLRLAGPKWTITQPFEACLVCRVCLADLAGVGSAASVLRAPDGVVDQADLRFFLNAYANGDQQADLTTRSARGTPGYARPNGRVDFEDMAFFLSLYAEATSVR